MDGRQTFRLVSCLFCLYHYEFTLQWRGKELESDAYKELTVTGKDLKACDGQSNVCVLDSKDCGSVHPHRKDFFLNISCRYFIHEEYFECKWIYLNDVKAKMIHSFIFSQTTSFSHCLSIFNPAADFGVTIKSKDAMSKTEVFSEVYTISMDKISQAPRPTITSVNATDTTLNVTWTSHWDDTPVQCQLLYKQSTEEQWIEVSETDSEMFHVIQGLQPLSQYSLTVACTGDYGLRSDWSETFQGMTLEGVPTAAPNISYCVEPLDHRTRKLLLVWNALQINEAGGVILGYKVTYESTKELFLTRTIITDLKAELVVGAGDYDIKLTAFNNAGQSPIRHIRINTALCEGLPRVKGLWASTEADSLRICWKIETAVSVSVSEFAIEWFSLGDAASKQWKRVSGSTCLTLQTGQVNPLETYSISVYPFYDSLCGPPTSIQANLESGTLLDIDQLQLVKVKKTSMTVQWVWKEKVPSTSVLQYRLELRWLNETRSLIIFPDQWQYTFNNLQTNVKYSVYIYRETRSGYFSMANIEFTTPLLEIDEILKAAVPVLLLIIGFGVFSVLSRTIFKEYFFPNIANPGHSVIGHWLLSPLHETDTTVYVLKPEDFPLASQLPEKCLTEMEPQKCSETDDVEEDKVLSELYLPDICSVENSDGVESSQVSPGFSEYVDLPLLPDNCGYVTNCHTSGSPS